MELEALKAVVEASVLNKRVYVEIVKIMHGEPSAADRADAKRLLSCVSFLGAQRGRSTEGLARSTFPEGTHSELFSSREENYTGTVAAALAKVRPTVAGRGALWIHQMRARGADNAAADVVLVVRSDDGNKFPMCVMEFGKRGGAESKEAQALSYAVNLQPYMKWNHVMLVAEMIYDEAPGHMTVSCVQMSHEEEDSSLARALLWSGDYSETSWARLLLAIEEVAKANSVADGYDVSDSLGGKEIPNTWEWNRTAAIEHEDDAPKLVWKEVAQERAKLMQDVLGDQICMYATRKDRVLVSYCYIPGSHEATSVGQFASLIEQIAKIHKKRIVHGDIRLGNVVFTDSGAELIDFDLCGKERRDRYPDRFLADIDDGVRHGDARADRLMRAEHDWFSAAAVMNLFQVADATGGSASEAFSTARTLLESGDHLQALELLAKHKDVAVKAETKTT
jgi:hypothetical protein